MYSCKRFEKYIPEMRKYIQDIASKRYLSLYEDGTEFSNEEYCDALREAAARWEAIYETTYYFPVIPLPSIKFSFMKLAVGILFKKKALYYMQNAASIGDVIEVSDFETKMQLYAAVGEQLMNEAEQELFHHKYYLLSGVRKVKR